MPLFEMVIGQKQSLVIYIICLFESMCVLHVAFGSITWFKINDGKEFGEMAANWEIWFAIVFDGERRFGPKLKTKREMNVALTLFPDCLLYDQLTNERCCRI